MACCSELSFRCLDWNLQQQPSSAPFSFGRMDAFPLRSWHNSRIAARPMPRPLLWETWLAVEIPSRNNIRMRPAQRPIIRNCRCDGCDWPCLTWRDFVRVLNRDLIDTVRRILCITCEFRANCGSFQVKKPAFMGLKMKKSMTVYLPSV